MRRAPLLVGVALAAALPLVAAAVPDLVRIPRARDARPNAPPANAVFSHWRHGAYRCYACHPALFPQAAQPFTHADMAEGRFCESCHDGGEARAVNGLRCEVCHDPR